ncbi:alpha/beta hydrolase [Lapidilactobacillus mulanensis]|uniref:Alpha/beta hydrolase n=1 Tax=Lapidilactobacillus mulanensis TaxID=2485999 RepID=A0ABW4DNY3_9LACO|nr:alpha/beta hydrolase family protein [Lapidilactobacillus mulanensis]
MAIATFNFYSQSLKKQTQFNVYLPTQLQKQQPVLFLLHGMGDNQNSWLDNSSLSRYANEYPFVIVMPDAGRSYYANTAYGANYWDYLTVELPTYLQTWLKLDLSKKNTFVAGLSMGGYGAFKWALRNPDRIGAAVSFSGRLDIGSSWNERIENFQHIFGSQASFQDSQSNLLNLVADRRVRQLPLFQLIGTDDQLLENNRTFHTFARQSLDKLDYREQTGNHDWNFWDTYLPTALRWLTEQYRLLNR